MQAVTVFAVAATSLPILATSASVTVTFAAGSYEIKAADLASLRQVAAAAAADPQLVVTIKEHTAGAKQSSLAYITEHDRALRMFQALVRAGVDPQRVAFEPVATAKIGTKDADKLTVGTSRDEAAQTTSKLTAQGDAPKPSDTDFTVNFASASAEPLNFGQERLQAFLATVGQPGRDAVVIEGHTDRVGNPTYNRALGELRALTVYEKLVRAGLPPYRVDTESHGGSGSAKAAAAGNGGSDRKVVIRWTKNEQVAAVAAKQEEPKVEEKQPEPQKPEPPETEPKKEKPAPEQPAAVERRGDLFDLVPFAGAIQPTGRLKSRAKAAATYGLGIGKAIWSTNASEGRVTLFASLNSKLPPKQADRNGTLNIRDLGLRFDYALGSPDHLRPFIGAGFGQYVWDATIKQPSTGLRNTGEKKDLGVLATLGLDVPLATGLFLAPELAWHKIGGNFAEALFTGKLSLRWRL